ncbi:MAG: bifunctional glutamate N-acetyltransferase/amino-acid acetyltransferase ArgJ [Deltaproteobacteria bacterium]|nr:bifunctional glutamate N-acetyltransferase/amino-acid acetyltransferase ArgJ [Deltaproteobacteria bacterium]
MKRTRATSTNTIKGPGFKFAGVACGIKKSKKKDLALIFCERPATAAALFTTNRVKAAPVLVGMRRMRRGIAQAVVVNSGNANACTGARGLRDAEATCRQVGARLGIDPGLVIPCSTGIIGVPMPMEKVRSGIERAAASLSADSFSHAAEAILTTDRFIKVASATCSLKGKKVVLAGMVKGAGMIAPNMATMLAYILTNAAVEHRSLRSILRRSAEESFNRVTVDGDVSTNDTVLFLANGLAGNSPVRRASREERVLVRAAQELMKELAIKLVEDGEGATKVVEVFVEGARTVAEAKKVAFSVGNSKLVKTAFFGSDPNFGRIMAAIGYAGVPIRPERIDIAFDNVTVVKSGVGMASREKKAARVLRHPSLRLKIDLHQGRRSAAVWTSDLSYEYVRINSAYRT